VVVEGVIGVVGVGVGDDDVDSTDDPPGTLVVPAGASDSASVVPGVRGRSLSWPLLVVGCWTISILVLFSILR